MNKTLKLFFIAFTMAVSTIANAANYVWTAGEEGNLIPSMEAFTATFTVTKTDKIYISAPELFTSVECDGVAIPQPEEPVYGNSKGIYVYSFDATEGQVVTVTSVFWMNPGSRVYITEGLTPLERVNLSPNESGKTFPWRTQGMVTVNFNKKVSATNAYIQCPTLNKATFSVDDIRISGTNSLSCNITTALNDAYEAGLKAGHPFNVVFEGVKDTDGNQYQNTGVLTITYLTPQPQGTLASATVGNGKSVEGYKFLSWFPEDETEGYFVFEFTTELGEVKGESCVDITMGNPDLISDGKFYRENLPVVVDGKKLYVDARGKFRSLARMFPSVDFASEGEGGESHFDFNTSYMTMQLKNIFDKNGNPMLSQGQGSVGSFTFSFPYAEITDDIAIDGNRSEDFEGSMKGSGSEVQLWIDQQVKSIDGARIYIQVDNGDVDEETQQPIYATGEIKIDKSDIKIISSSADETIIGFTLPELKAMVTEGGNVENPQEKEFAAAAGTDIRVVLMVTTTNGMPHDLVINYVFGSATGICSLPTINARQAAVYNLSGQRVASNTKGIVIINGAKVVKK